MKTCTKCKQIKDFSLFSKRAKAADGLTHYCKDCLKVQKKEWQIKNQDRVKEYRNSYIAENAAKVKASQKRYREENAEKVKKARADKYLRTREQCLAKVKENAAKRKPEILAYQEAYRNANRERLNAAARVYQAENWDAKKAYMRKYCKERRANDPVFAVARRLRARMGVFFRKSGFGKPAKTYDLIGCSFENLVSHLESKFLEGMTWSNRKEWHIDHKVPLSSAKGPEDLKALFHYTNLQPLWAFDNISKGGKMPEEVST